MPVNDETDRRKVRKFRLCAFQIIDACGAPADSEIIQAASEDGTFIFTLRNDAWSPVPEGQDIPVMEGKPNA
jgi:hypothetical protein